MTQRLALASGLLAIIASCTPRDAEHLTQLNDDTDGSYPHRVYDKPLEMTPEAERMAAVQFRFWNEPLHAFPPSEEDTGASESPMPPSEPWVVFPDSIPGCSGPSTALAHVGGMGHDASSRQIPYDPFEEGTLPEQAKTDGAGSHCYIDPEMSWIMVNLCPNPSYFIDNIRTTGLMARDDSIYGNPEKALFPTFVGYRLDYGDGVYTGYSHVSFIGYTRGLNLTAEVGLAVDPFTGTFDSNEGLKNAPGVKLGAGVKTGSGPYAPVGWEATHYLYSPPAGEHHIIQMPHIVENRVDSYGYDILVGYELEGMILSSDLSWKFDPLGAYSWPEVHSTIAEDCKTPCLCREYAPTTEEIPFNHNLGFWNNNISDYILAGLSAVLDGEIGDIDRYDNVMRAVLDVISPLAVEVPHYMALNTGSEPVETLPIAVVFNMGLADRGYLSPTSTIPKGETRVMREVAGPFLGKSYEHEECSAGRFLFTAVPEPWSTRQDVKFTNELRDEYEGRSTIMRLVLADVDPETPDASYVEGYVTAVRVVRAGDADGLHIWPTDEPNLSTKVPMDGNYIYIPEEGGRKVGPTSLTGLMYVDEEFGGEDSLPVLEVQVECLENPKRGLTYEPGQMRKDGYLLSFAGVEYVVTQGGIYGDGGIDFLSVSPKGRENEVWGLETEDGKNPMEERDWRTEFASFNGYVDMNDEPLLFRLEGNEPLRVGSAVTLSINPEENVIIDVTNGGYTVVVFGDQFKYDGVVLSEYP